MSQPRYKLTYWPTAFRGCFISYLLAYKDVAFEISSDMDAIIALKSMAPADQETPFMGPPLLKDLETGKTITQTPAIVLYLAHDLDLYPENMLAVAQAMKVQMDCNDVLMEICCHNGSSMWTRENWINFRQNRLPRWMTMFEEEVKRGTIGGDKVNFADIATFALFGNMIRCLEELEPDLKRHAPNVYALCEQIGKTPSLTAFIASEEEKYGKSYCMGQIEKSIRAQLSLDQGAID